MQNRMRRMIKQERDFVRELRKRVDKLQDMTYTFNDPCISGGYRLIIRCESVLRAVIADRIVRETMEKYPSMSVRIEVTSYPPMHERIVRVFYKCDESIRPLHYGVYSTVGCFERSKGCRMTREQVDQYVRETYKNESNEGGNRWEKMYQ